jgi:hypothetical protein
MGIADSEDLAGAKSKLNITKAARTQDVEMDDAAASSDGPALTTPMAFRAHASRVNPAV